MSIKYLKGNLLKAPQPLIAHQVNCQGVMGSGVAKAIKESFPVVYLSYRKKVLDFKVETGLDTGFLLGDVQFVDLGDQVYCNVFSQDNYMPRTECHTNYGAMEKAFRTMKEEYPGKDLAIPKIGCGLGGGDWNKVTEILGTVFDDRDVYVYELDSEP